MKSNKKVILKNETGLEIKSKSIDMTSIRQSAGQLPKLIKKDNLLESNQEEFITKNEIKKAFYPIIFCLAGHLIGFLKIFSFFI
mgnify:CR=1 FL=1